MKICIIGPGLLPIPPNGWGAIEIIIWDYKQILEELGHDVYIINTRSYQEIINLCNSYKPDFVHVQYDEYWSLCDYLECKNVAITTYYAYAEQEYRHDLYYSNIMKGISGLKKSYIFSVSPRISKKYIERGFEISKLFDIPSGVRDDLFNFSEECEFSEKSIYLAKIDFRKRQFLFHNIDSLFFAGNIADDRYNKNNYLGEWSKDFLYTNLTKYANLVLLSDGEAHPLVCMEAMVSGLGLVISEYCTANLDLNLPFIDVIPENKINDIEYITKIIEKNRKISITMRNEIRKYAIDNFSLMSIIKNKYLPTINKLI